MQGPAVRLWKSKLQQPKARADRFLPKPSCVTTAKGVESSQADSYLAVSGRNSDGGTLAFSIGQYRGRATALRMEV